MRQKSPEEYVRSCFYYAIFVFVLGMGVLFLIAWRIPFDVDLNTLVVRTNGTWFWVDDSDNDRRFEETVDMSVRAGESIRLEGDATATLEIIPDSNAFVYLTDLADWKLVSSERHGTAFEHALHSAKEYRIIIEQTAGTAVYDFSQSDPSLDKVQLTLRFRDGEYEPEIPCFQASVPIDGLPSEVVEVPCRSEVEVD